LVIGSPAENGLVNKNPPSSHRGRGKENWRQRFSIRRNADGVNRRVRIAVVRKRDAFSRKQKVGSGSNNIPMAIIAPEYNTIHDECQI